jgi:hypothetical protein
MVRARSPARWPSKSAASSAPAGYSVPPTVHAVRSRISSHCRYVSISASIGTSMRTRVPSGRRRYCSLVKNSICRRTRSRAKPALVVVGADVHVAGLPLEDRLGLGERGAAPPQPGRPRVPRGGQRAGPDVGAHVDPVGVDPADAALRLGQREAVGHELQPFQVELPHHAGVRAAARQAHEAPVEGGAQHRDALPDPVLALRRRERVDVDEHLPHRFPLAVLVERRAPPQAPGVLGVAPEVVQLVAAPPGERDPLVGVEDLAQRPAKRGEPGVAVESCRGLGVAFGHPAGGLGPFEILKPVVRVLGRLRHVASLPMPAALAPSDYRRFRPSTATGP